MSAQAGSIDGAAGRPRWATRAGRWLSAWNPLRWCFGPVFQKEMRSASRRRGTYMFRFVYALLLAIFVGLTIWGIVQSGRENAGWDGAGIESNSLILIESLQTVAPAVTMLVGWMQYLVLGLTMPGMTAPLINGERRQKTMPALLTTPLTAAEIVLGKLTARLGLMAIVVLLGLPLLLAVRVLGGASAASVVQLMGVTLSTALLGASAGIMCSVWVNRTTGAMSLAMVLVLALHVGPAIFVAVSMMGMAGTWGQEVALVTCSPFVMGVITAELMGGRLPIGGDAWWMHSLYNVGWSMVFVVVAITSLRRRMLWLASHEGQQAASASRAKAVASVQSAPDSIPADAEGQPGDPSRDQARANSPLAKVMANSSSGHERGHDGRQEVDHGGGQGAVGRSREVGDDPMMWREMRRPIFQQRWLAWLMLVSVGVLMAWIYNESGIENEGTHIGLLVGFWSLWVLAMLSASTSAVVSEREGQTWQGLISTALSPMQILKGMLWGFVGRQWVHALIVGTALGIALISGMARMELIVHAILIIGPTVVFIGVLGLVVAMWKKSLVSVGSYAAALGFAIWAGPWIVLAGLSASVGIDDDVVEVLSQLLVTVNPVALMAIAVEGAMEQRRTNVPYDMPIRNLSLGWFTMYVVAFAAFYIVVSYGLRGWAVNRFRRMNGQSS
jgi:ABC-type transport system involved in multi-copper enzyme maturation permease subunit